MGQTVAYPFDVCRRRLQVSGWAGAQKLHADHGRAVAYRGMVDCFSRTVKEEGMQVGVAGGGGWECGGGRGVGGCGGGRGWAECRPCLCSGTAAPWQAWRARLEAGG